MAPKIAIFGSSLRFRTGIGTADRLTEYDIVVVSPTPEDLGISIAHSRIPYEVFSSTVGTLESRRIEFLEFLRRGGIGVVFMRAPSPVLDSTERNALYPLAMVLTRPEIGSMGFLNDSGTSKELLDADDPIAPYLEQITKWVATIDGGVIAGDPHGYPLAVNRESRIIAFVEHVGEGTLYWVPPATLEVDWGSLIDAATNAWASTADPLVGLAAAELDKVRDEIGKIQNDSRRQIAALRGQSNEILARRRKLVDEDRAAARALQHYRAAQHSAPAKGLDFLHRMVETIEHEYGNEAKAISELGYSKSMLSDITRPANHRPYRARHEGGEGEAVPEDELKKAFSAASDILSRFLARRLNELN